MFIKKIKSFNNIRNDKLNIKYFSEPSKGNDIDSKAGELIFLSQ